MQCGPALPSIDVWILAYTGPVPLNYGKLVTKYPRICGQFFYGVRPSGDEIRGEVGVGIPCCCGRTRSRRVYTGEIGQAALGCASSAPARSRPDRSSIRRRGTCSVDSRSATPGRSTGRPAPAQIDSARLYRDRSSLRCEDRNVRWPHHSENDRCSAPTAYAQLTPPTPDVTKRSSSSRRGRQCESDITPTARRHNRPTASNAEVACYLLGMTTCGTDRQTYRQTPDRSFTLTTVDVDRV